MTKLPWRLMQSVFVMFSLCCFARPAAAQVESPTSRRTPVIVELFTSEGCSSCPPADLLLQKLEAEQPLAGADVIGLEEHVDYWNHDGWIDPYSSPEWTQRQLDYGARLTSEPYTPQMVVDGESQFVGSDARDASIAIRKAASSPKTGCGIYFERPRSQRHTELCGNDKEARRRYAWGRCRGMAGGDGRWAALLRESREKMPATCSRMLRRYDHCTRSVRRKKTRQWLSRGCAGETRLHTGTAKISRW